MSYNHIYLFLDDSTFCGLGGHFLPQDDNCAFLYLPEGLSHSYIFPHLKVELSRAGPLRLWTCYLIFLGQVHLVGAGSAIAFEVAGERHQIWAVVATDPSSSVLPLNQAWTLGGKENLRRKREGSWLSLFLCWVKEQASWTQMMGSLSEFPIWGQGSDFPPSGGIIAAPVLHIGTWGLAKLNVYIECYAVLSIQLSFLLRIALGIVEGMTWWVSCGSSDTLLLLFVLRSEYCCPCFTNEKTDY